jgi:hypothetical protein
MNTIPTAKGQEYENHPDGFCCPYKFLGKIEEELLRARYNRLRKQSHGLIKRLGLPDPRDR